MYKTSEGSGPGASVSISEGVLEEVSVCSAFSHRVIESWKEMGSGNIASQQT